MTSKELNEQKIIPLRKELTRLETEYRQLYRQEKANENGLKVANCDNCAHSSIVEITDHNMCLKGNCTYCTGFCYSWAPETEVSAYLRKNHHYDDGIAYRLEKLFGENFATLQDTKLIFEALDFMKKVEETVRQNK